MRRIRHRTVAELEKEAQEAHAWLVAHEQERGDFLQRRRTALQRLHDEGMSLAEIADLIGVSKSRIAQIVRENPSTEEGR